MSDYSSYESRVGKLNVNAQDVYNFASDIRNFEKFVSQEKVSGVVIDETSCSFNVQGVGTLEVCIAEKIPYSKVAYKVLAMHDMEFLVVLDIVSVSLEQTEVLISIQAQLNPVMKMMIAEPLQKFMEMIIVAIENYNEWK